MGEDLHGWKKAAARALEHVLLVDRALRVHYLNRPHPGGPDPTGAPLMDFIQPGGQPVLGSVIEEVFATGEPGYCEVEAPGPHGRFTPYSVWVIPVGPANDLGMVALVCADLGERQRAERALQDEKEVLRSLLDNAPDTVMILDRSHRVQFINHLTLGFTREQIIGRNAHEFLPEAERARVQAVVESVFVTGQPGSFEVQVNGPRGAFIFSEREGPIVIDGKVQRVSLVATDVTDRFRREKERAREREALKQSEERFRVLVEHAPEALVIFDVDSKRFVQVNQKACTFFELPPEALLELGPADLSPEVQPDGRASAQQNVEYIAAALAGQAPVFEWVHLTGSGRPLPCEVRLVRLPDAERTLVRGSIIDISERKRAEAERARLQAELFQAQKMQAIGQLTGGVAHDFNNLLTVVMSHAELLGCDADDPGAVHRHSEEICAASRRAASLTQQLLAFARKQPLQPRVIDVGALVLDVAELLRRTLGKPIDIQTITPGEPLVCKVDPMQLENALLNIAINARDAMPEGGTLRVRVVSAELPAREDGDGTPVPAGHYATLSVEDDGCGVAPELRDQVFEPFFTTKEVGGGSGLGLSMVYGFVKQSGGQIDLHSEVGRGTRVDIHLPLHEGPALHERETVAKSSSPRGLGETVLVIEDEPQVRSVIVSQLRRLGYRPLEACDAMTGIEALEANRGVALLLTDVMLPGDADGIELARRCRARLPGLAVVFMSGYPSSAGASLTTGTLFLKKPFNQDELARMLRAGLEAPGSANAATTETS
ncbi:MAG: PAS domain S-box protein [Myxococcales bacterium]|nr:PAS domain S-box protein [Myxococcales bacterium]